MTKKYSLLIGLLIIIVMGGALTVISSKNNNEAGSTNSSVEPTTLDQENVAEPQEKIIRLIATGDMIPHDTVNLRANNTQSGYENMLKPVKSILDGADVTVCNQESPSAGSTFGISGYPSFNAPYSFATALNQSGCNVITLANNHIADRGELGALETLKHWQKQDILAVSGVNQSRNSVDFIEVKGATIAIVAMTEFSNAQISSDLVNFITEENIKSALAKAQSADYIIVAAHWGAEAPELTNNQVRYAQMFIDAGADLIIGNGPHLVQKFEIIDDVPVFYSLGNALTTQLGIDQLTGIFAVVDLVVDENGVSTAQLGYLPVYMHYTWTKQEEQSEDLLARDNLILLPLDQAEEYLKDTRFNETLQSRNQYISNQIEQNGELKIYSSTEF